MGRNTEEIRRNVSIPDVLRRYGYSDNRMRRIPCPVHHGKKPNFSYNETVYHCFSCGTGGDVIRLVMDLFNLTFSQAVVKISSDFSLGLAMRRPSRSEMEAIRLTRRIDADILAENQRKERYYMQIASVYRTINKKSLTDAIRGLSEYLLKMENWLDQNLEEVKYPFE